MGTVHTVIHRDASLELQTDFNAFLGHKHIHFVQYDLRLHALVYIHILKKREQLKRKKKTHNNSSSF